MTESTGWSTTATIQGIFLFTQQIQWPWLMFSQFWRSCSQCLGHRKYTKRTMKRRSCLTGLQFAELLVSSTERSTEWPRANGGAESVMLKFGNVKRTCEVSGKPRELCLQSFLRSNLLRSHQACYFWVSEEHLAF